MAAIHDLAAASAAPADLAPQSKEDVVTVLTRLGDDHLILGHRLSEWCGHAPMLEEDLALPNIALDLIGGARVLYSYAGVVEGAGRDEDDFAFLRDGTGFRHLLMAERPNGDFAFTILRQFFYAAFMHPFWHAMQDSADATLAAHAAKAVKEFAYHIRHCGEWVIRLGDGTAESARRIQAACDELAPYVGELFETDEVYMRLAAANIMPDMAAIRSQFDSIVTSTFATAMMPPFEPEFSHSGGRFGRHSESLGHLLAELQFMQRAYPGQKW